jgi:hypothetical protein
MKHPYLLLLFALVFAVQAHAVVLYEAYLPGGGVASVDVTQDGFFVFYDVDGVDRVSVVGRSTRRTTTRSTVAPLTLWMGHDENVPWLDMLTYPLTDFVAHLDDGSTEFSSFTPLVNPDQLRRVGQFKSMNAVSVPETTAWAWITLPLVFFFLRRRKSAPTSAK